MIALYGERVETLKYKAHNSPEWLALCTELKNQCKSQNVSCSKTPQQCKNKLNQLTKKYKEAKDKLRQSGFGKDGGNSSEDSRSDAGEDTMIPNHFEEIDDIMGVREIADPEILESSVSEEDSVLTDISPESDNEDENQTIASAMRKRKSKNDDTNPKPRKERKKKGSNDELIEFMERMEERQERSEERQQNSMEKMMTMERDFRESQQKFNLDVLNMISQTLKEIVKK